MPLSGITSASLSLSQSQAQWDAIAAIKSVSPFAADNDARTTSAAATLDAMLPGYGTMAAASAATSGDDVAALVADRIQAAQQSTIDLYA